ncbi:MAG: hypothetical protein EOO20_02860 [Chryseobacterium sp.]|uniref:HRDC domain-containing protein n=1 Tax=Pedobacter agri TaxID=454586 RepID=UPI00120D5EF4|nr:HRDC domain-containing protein [Pedobacter agri]RZJ92127.1 MAG: hypothetical protein EOO20_02860 [Chryseobacterium sp.]
MESSNKIIDSLINSTSQNIFITGKAGTGKTTMLQSVKQSVNKNVIVVAYTASAALNAGGITISSFFQLPRGPVLLNGAERNTLIERISSEKLKLIRSLEMLIIDEVSMVRADTLDYLDVLLRTVRASDLSFGGVQVLVFGDLFQLPPIVGTEWDLLSKHYDTPYFFSSKAFSERPFAIFELDKVHRQKDEIFIDILNSIRSNDISDNLLDVLNSRFFVEVPPNDYITITTHNYHVDSINAKRLQDLNGVSYSYKAIVKGEYPKDSFPCSEDLVLKVGALVVMARNDSSGQNLYHNGRPAEICELDRDSIKVRFIDDSVELMLSREKWDFVEYELSSEGKVKESTLGSFEQFPVKLGWAITVHKSQGLTFDKAVIDIAGSFAHGQAYVALSRCRTLDGLILDKKVTRDNLINDKSVVDFMKKNRSTLDASFLERARCDDTLSFVLSNFSFSLLIENFRRLVTAFPEELSAYEEIVVKELGGVAQHFVRKEFNGFSGMSITDFSNTRLKDASVYFLPRLVAVSEKLYEIVKQGLRMMPSIEKVFELTSLELEIKKIFFDKIATGDSLSDIRLSTALLLRTFSFLAIDSAERMSSNPRLYSELCEWRKSQSKKRGVPERFILSDKTLLKIIDKVPKSLDALASISGIGTAKARNIGEDLFKVITQHSGKQELF